MLCTLSGHDRRAPLMNSGIGDAALLHIGRHSVDGAIRSGDSVRDGRLVPYVRLNRDDALA